MSIRTDGITRIRQDGGKCRQLHASEIFAEDDCGLILETEDYQDRLLLYQDGEVTPVSDLLGRENRVFVVVPKAEVENELDWPACAWSHADRRLPVFEAGRYLLAF